MSNVKVTLSKKLRPLTEIYIDGVLMSPKKQKSTKKYGFSYTTDKRYCEIEVRSYSRFQTRLWLLWELLFFVVSVFGIFDVRYGKFTYNTYCKMQVDVANDTDILLRVMDPRNNGVVARIETDAKVNILDNEYIIDRVAKKKQKVLNVFKVLLILAIVAIVIAKVIIK